LYSGCSLLSCCLLLLLLPCPQALNEFDVFMDAIIPVLLKDVNHAFVC
jgi:hypothetical protein